MVFLTILYLVLVWLVFYKYRWVRLDWVSGTVAALVGLAILGVFLALLNGSSRRLADVGSRGNSSRSHFDVE